MKRYLLVRIASVLFALHVFTVPRVTAADEAAAPEDAENTRQQKAHDHVRTLKLRSVGADSKEIELIDHPLLVFTDPARLHRNGTVWAWGAGGRPVAFMELWSGSARWVHAVTLTSEQQVELTTPEGDRWLPVEMPSEPVLVAEAPQPAEKASVRLRQLKDIARRFTAHEFWQPDNSRFELRLLIQPVYRYSDPTAEIQDGAAFIFAHGTNPEAIILIEALGKSPVEASWYYHVARSSSAELHVELDGREVWVCQRADGRNRGPTKAHFLFKLTEE